MRSPQEIESAIKHFEESVSRAGEDFGYVMIAMILVDLLKWVHGDSSAFDEIFAALETVDHLRDAGASPAQVDSYVTSILARKKETEN